MVYGLLVFLVIVVIEPLLLDAFRPSLCTSGAVPISCTSLSIFPHLHVVIPRNSQEIPRNRMKSIVSSFRTFPLLAHPCGAIPGNSQVIPGNHRHAVAIPRNSQGIPRNHSPGARPRWRRRVTRGENPAAVQLRPSGPCGGGAGRPGLALQNRPRQSICTPWRIVDRLTSDLNSKLSSTQLNSELISELHPELRTQL